MYIKNEDTICAPATSVGSGAVSVIRMSGPEAFSICDRLVSFRNGTAAQSKGGRVKFGVIINNCEVLDEVLVSVFRAPHSYTGEDSVEIACHASNFIVGRILELLCGLGCRLAEAGEFTQRAFVNGKMDLAQAEAVADVISSSSSAQHRIAMQQLRGGYSAELAGIRTKLLELTALMELELDFSEEDVEFADRSRLKGLVDLAYRKCYNLAESFRLGNVIKNGVPVAIVGAPNSGKSTLLNALLKDERAIVSDIPGTTRDTIEETSVLENVLFRFIDTAGIREASDEVEKMGIERTFAKIASAEIVLGMVDASAGEEKILEEVSGLISLVCGESVARSIREDVDLEYNTFTHSHSGSGERQKKLIILLNKADLLGTEDENGASLSLNKNVIDINNIVASLNNQGLKIKLLQISAKSGIGLNSLNKTLVSLVSKVNSEEILVTNARHAAALQSAATALLSVRKGLDVLSSDLLAEDLREALRALSSITGEITTDEVLGEIFGRFCIGK